MNDYVTPNYEENDFKKPKSEKKSMKINKLSQITYIWGIDRRLESSLRLLMQTYLTQAHSSNPAPGPCV